MPPYESVVKRSADPHVKLRMAWPGPLVGDDIKNAQVEYRIVPRRSKLNIGVGAQLVLVAGGVLVEEVATPSLNHGRVARWGAGQYFLTSDVVGDVVTTTLTTEVLLVKNWHEMTEVRQQVISARIAELHRLKRDLAESKEDSVLARIRRYAVACNYELGHSFIEAARDMGCSRESFSREFTRLKTLHEKHAETPNKE